jgi:hypothetical protein
MQVPSCALGCGRGRRLHDGCLAWFCALLSRREFRHLGPLGWSLVGAQSLGRPRKPWRQVRRTSDEKTHAMPHRLGRRSLRWCFFASPFALHHSCLEGLISWRTRTCVCHISFVAARKTGRREAPGATAVQSLTIRTFCFEVIPSSMSSPPSVPFHT